MQIHSPNKLDRYLGTLFGAAIGDALGTPYEFWHQEKVRVAIDNNGLQLIPFTRGSQTFPAGFYTDDTSMTICLAVSLIERGFDLEDQFRRYRKWFLEGYSTPLDDRAYGIGQHTFQSLSKDFDMSTIKGGINDPKAAGNGSLMRCSPIALMYQGDYDQIREKSLLSSFVTHQNILAGWCCVAQNSIISLIIEGIEKPSLLKHTLSLHNGMPRELIDLLQADFSFGLPAPYFASGYCLNTLCVAIHSFLENASLSDALKTAICFGGDTDTFASVTGALAGTYYGYESIPQEWRATIMKKNHLIYLADQLTASSDPSLDPK